MEPDSFDLLTKLAAASAPPLNIAVIGATGVGKSRLINSFFGYDVAEVGVGRPVTTEIKAHEVPNSNVAIFDTRGLEVQRSAETIAQLEQLIVEARQRPNVDEHIHVAWLCVSAASRRFEPVYELVAQMLTSARVPFVIAITKSFGPEALELEQYIRSIAWIKAPTVRVVAAPKTAGGEIVVHAFGLGQLAQETAELVGPARAAAADYRQYDQARREIALSTLRRIVERKTLLQSIGTMYAMMGYGLPMMLAMKTQIAGKVCEDIGRAASDLGVGISQEVMDYLREIVAYAVFESARAKGAATLDRAGDAVGEVFSGDFSSLGSIAGGLWNRAKATVSLSGALDSLVKSAKGERTELYGHQAWEYIREITLVMLAPIVEAHLAGQPVVGKRDSFGRSLKAVLRWSETAKSISAELVPVLYGAADKHL